MSYRLTSLRSLVALLYFRRQIKMKRMSQIADEDVYMNAYYRLCYYYYDS